MQTELKLGLMTNSELAEWFDIKPNYLSRNKAKKLKELESFARFEVVKTKVRILEIYQPYYIKKSTRTYEYYKSEVPKAWRVNELDTCARVSAQIYEPSIGIAPKTSEYYTANVRNELWGKPDKHNPHCHAELAKMYRSADGDKAKTRYEAFTPEDDQKYVEMFKKFYGPIELNLKEQTMIREQVKAGILTKEDAYDMIMHNDSYPTFLRALSAELGCDFVVRATRVSE